MHMKGLKDLVVGEERIAQYLLAVLNTRGTPDSPSLEALEQQETGRDSI
jgi:hypothetical protein